jgi:hypothetical protein
MKKLNVLRLPGFESQRRLLPPHSTMKKLNVLRLSAVDAARLLGLTSQHYEEAERAEA